MTEKDDFALVPRPQSAVEKFPPGVPPILSSIVADTLALAKNEQSEVVEATFRIGDYEWCEPDYRQILLWAKTLSVEPEDIIARLQHGERAWIPEEFGAETSFSGGRLLKINWDFDLLRMQDSAEFVYFDGEVRKDRRDFEWVKGLKTTHLALHPHGRSMPLFEKSLGIQLPELTHLVCADLGIARLDCSGTPKLQRLVCRHNRLGELNLSSVPHLTTLWCDGNRLRQLELGCVPKLVSLHCGGNYGIKELDLSRLPLLEELDYSWGELSHLDLSRVPKLRRLSGIYNQNLTELNLCGAQNLEYLNCWYNKLSRVDLSGTPNLVELRCANNEIKELELKHVPKLETLICFGNRIDVLDIRPLAHLRELTYINEGESGMTETRLIQRPDQHF